MLLLKLESNQHSTPSHALALQARVCALPIFVHENSFGRLRPREKIGNKQTRDAAAHSMNGRFGGSFPPKQPPTHWIIYLYYIWRCFSRAQSIIVRKRRAHPQVPYPSQKSTRSINNNDNMCWFAGTPKRCTFPQLVRFSVVGQRGREWKSQFRT